MSWEEIFKSLVFWGPGAVIAGLMLWIFYKLATNLGMKFIDAQKDQATALGRQAQSMEGLQQAITGFVTKDNSEHRDMLVLLKYIAQQQETNRTVCEEHTEHRKESCPYKKTILKITSTEETVEED